MHLHPLKARPADFRVTESLGLETAPRDASTQWFIRTFGVRHASAPDEVMAAAMAGNGRV